MTSIEDFGERLGLYFLHEQYLEAALKDYIGCAYDWIRFAINDRLPFKWDKAEINEFTLGKLIRHFEKLSNNPDLIQRLQQFNKSRIKYVHKYFPEHAPKTLRSDSWYIELNKLDDDIKKCSELIKQVQEMIAQMPNSSNLKQNEMLDLTTKLIEHSKLAKKTSNILKTDVS